MVFVRIALGSLRKSRFVSGRRTWKAHRARGGALVSGCVRATPAALFNQTRGASGGLDRTLGAKAVTLDYVHIPSKDISEAARKSPPIIFLHGLLASWRTYRTLLQRRELAPDRDVYALDLRNHGTSPHDEDASYDAMIRDVLAFMAAHAIDRACVMGHSMGGKLAMALALAHPHFVSELVVVDAAPVVYNERPKGLEHAQEDTPQAVVEALARLDPLPPHLRTRKDIDEALRHLGIRSHDVRQFALTNLVRTGDPSRAFSWRVNAPVLAKNINQIMGIPEWMQQSVAADSVFAGLTTNDREREASRFVYRGPGLFIRGSRSNYVRDSHWPIIQRLFPNASLVTIEDAGHWLQSEKPTEFIQVVNAFLDRCASAVSSSKVAERRPVS
ncbi:hypothetical protein CCYA_CCYA01G0270 [Cyanidiococcus yangmingshanensis]|nr:hypothetical protein CCYA_CCYA01G0270 [Cyanidiococcus yangmingshanensis]